MDTELSKDPGSNIDSWCGKCKLVLAHTIEAKVGEKPVRVCCNTCKSQHSYKAHPPNSNPRAAKGTGTGTTRRSSKAANRYQELLSARDGTAAKNYSPKDRYETGDVLEHATFGRGAVTAVKDGTKIEVLFNNGAKLLVHSS